MRPLSALVLALVAVGLVRGQPEGEVLPRQERRFDRHLQEAQRREGDPILIQYFEDDGDKDDGSDEEVTLTSKEDSSDMYDGDLEEGDLKEHPSSVLGLVPQLWPNYTEPTEQPADEVSCDEARLKCVFRAGCGVALQNYVVGCGDLTSGKSRACNAHCRNALTALMSTPEGHRLMKCNCSGDAFCATSKSRLEPCEAEVLHATRNDTVVSCATAQWICGADPQCATALEYYNNFCEAMFRGKRCTDRCLNSIHILQRQAAAAKLESCACSGEESFDCPAIKRNMQRLCFTKDQENEVEPATKAGEWPPLQCLRRVLAVVALFVSAVLRLLQDAFKVHVA